MDYHVSQKLHLLASACALVGALAVLPVSASYAQGAGAGAAGSGNTGASTSTNGAGAGSTQTNPGYPGAATGTGAATANPNLGTEPTNYGGNSSSNISPEGQMNTNGPNATNRTLGQSRAATRHRIHRISHTRTHHHLHTTSTGLHRRTTTRLHTTSTSLHRGAGPHRHLRIQSTSFSRSRAPATTPEQMNSNGANTNGMGSPGATTQQPYVNGNTTPSTTGPQNQQTTPPANPPGSPQ
jgi:hypothetical protein